MTEEFVPYVEALALKELGFDEPTLYHWHSSEKNHPLTNETYFTGCQPHTNSGIKDIGNENHTWSAPLYQQAFRWFRKNHKIHAIITLYSQLGNPWRYYIANEGGERGFNTYEEAELACLRKLIEIVKTKKK